MEGRYKVKTLGTYPIKAEHITKSTHKSNKSKTYFTYKLNKSGIDYLKLINANYSLDFDLVDDQFIKNIIIQNQNLINSLQKETEKYKTLLAEQNWD